MVHEFLLENKQINCSSQEAGSRPSVAELPDAKVANLLAKRNLEKGISMRVDRLIVAAILEEKMSVDIELEPGESFYAPGIVQRLQKEKGYHVKLTGNVLHVSWWHPHLYEG